MKNRFQKKFQSSMQMIMVMLNSGFVITHAWPLSRKLASRLLENHNGKNLCILISNAIWWGLLTIEYVYIIAFLRLKVLLFLDSLIQTLIQIRKLILKMNWKSKRSYSKKEQHIDTHFVTSSTLNKCKIWTLPQPCFIQEKVKISRYTITGTSPLL